MRLIAALAASALFVLGAGPQESAKLVVHEWGTFTSVAGQDGASLDWRPLAGPSDLPSFVYDESRRPKGLRHGEPVKSCSREHKNGSDCGKSCTQGTTSASRPRRAISNLRSARPTVAPGDRLGSCSPSSPFPNSDGYVIA